MSDKIDHLGKLQQKLYARDPESAPKQKFGILRPLKDNVDSSWGENELPDQKKSRRPTVSGYKRFFIISIIFFIAALAAALFSVYRGAITLSSKNVEVAILGNSFVSGGETLPVQVDITNKNASDLVEAQLTLSYPKGSLGNTNIGDMERIKKLLGTISSGKTKTEGFSVILYGEQGTSRTVTATLEYKLQGSNAVFVKEKTFSVMISSSPVSLTVDAPSSTTSNQPFILNIRTIFTGDTLLDNAIVRVEYPNGYVFSSAIPEPNTGNNTWDLGDLVKGTEKTISIKGKLIGEEQDEKSFRIYVGSRTSETDARIAISYNSALHSIVISEPFIAGRIFINGDSSDIVALTNGSSVSGYIDWKNNAAIAITEPEFVLSISGDNINTDSLENPGGYYDKLNKTITWNNQTSLGLLRLESGAKGKLPFSFNTKQAKSGSDGDIVLSLSIKGTYPDRDFLQDSVSGVDQKIVRFASKLQFAAQSLYSVGPIKNSGPFPPKVDKDTTYTIQWFMRPVENPLSGAIATATLPIGVVWTGVISPQSEAISYVPETRVVTWNIGSLPKSSNIPTVRTASFQVKVKPSKNQVDSKLYLIGEVDVQATDTVSKLPLSTTRPELTNELSADPAYSIGQEKVLP